MREVYSASMTSLHESIEEPVALNGDGRFSSPGHSAMYGLYSLMDSKSSKIIAASLLKVFVFVHSKSVSSLFFLLPSSGLKLVKVYIIEWLEFMLY